MDDQEKHDQFQRALNYAHFFLKFRPRTEKEVKDYLKKKSEKFMWSEATIEEVIERLKYNNFVNDADFVSWFVEQRSSGKPKSQFALSHELQKFGVDKNSVNEYFQNHPIEEDELALQALKRKWRSLQNFDKKIRFQKAAAFLSRRGFNFEIIKRSIDVLESE